MSRIGLITRRISRIWRSTVPEEGKKKRRVVATDQKILKELVDQGKTLKHIEQLLDNIWQERRPT